MHRHRIQEGWWRHKWEGVERTAKRDGKKSPRSVPQPSAPEPPTKTGKNAMELGNSGINPSDIDLEWEDEWTPDPDIDLTDVNIAGETSDPVLASTSTAADLETGWGDIE